MQQPSFKYHLLAELITALKANGFAIGTGQHLKIQQLLSQLPEDMDTEGLALHLCPLFAQSPKQQDIFHDAFKTALQNTEAYYQAITPKPTPVSEQQEERRWQWLFALLGLALLVPPLVFFFLTIFTPSTSQQIITPFEIQGGTARVICLSDTIELKELPTVEKAALIYQKDSTLGTVTIDTPYCITYQAESLSGQDSLIVELQLADGSAQNVIFLPIIEGIIDDDEASTPVVDTKPFTFQEKIIPYDHDLLYYYILPPPPWRLFIAQHFWWLKWIGFALFTALLTAIWMYRSSKRQKLVAEAQKIDRPPYVHTIRLEGIDSINLGREFNLLLNKIRQRTTDEARLLNIPKSINATIHKAGMATFLYKQRTKPPEYLLLINQQHTQNHRARFFDYVFKTFKSSDVLIERFFFDGDPRVCYNAEFPKGIRLQELQNKYRGSRLILLSNGNALLNKFSGKPVDWHDLILSWKTRVLFSPKATAEWGKKERRLGKILTVLPMSLKSLHFWLEQLENAEDAVFGHWPEVVQDAPKNSIKIDGSLISCLEKHYDEQMLLWIASCAIYPTLHWDLTLFLGQQLSQPSEPLLEAKKILALAQLPWFVEGKIPEASRLVLVDWLEVNHPQQLRQLRKKLVEVLNTVPPPNDSTAFEEYSMNLALNDWLSTSDRSHKRQLEEQIAHLVNQGEEIDITVLKKLEAPRTSLDFVLPDQLKAKLYPQGLPALGSQKNWKDLFKMICFLWLPALLLTACWPWPVQVSNCNDALNASIALSEENKDALESYPLCITDATGVYHLWEKQVFLLLERDSIPSVIDDLLNGEMTTPLSLSDTISGEEERLSCYLSRSKLEIQDGVFEKADRGISFTPEQSGLDSLRTFWPQFQQNIAVELYNIGVDYHRQYEADTSNLDAQANSCVYFNIALQIAPDAFSAEEQAQINRWCNAGNAYQTDQTITSNCYKVSIPTSITVRTRPLTELEKQQLNEQASNSRAWNQLPVNKQTYLGALSNGEEVQLLEETTDHYKISSGVYEGYIVKRYGGKRTLIPCSESNNTVDQPTTTQRPKVPINKETPSQLQQINISGTVVEASSGKAISDFAIHYTFGSRSPTYLTRANRAGRFERILTSGDLFNELNSGRSVRFLTKTSGYDSQTLSWKKGDRPLNFKLSKTPPREAEGNIPPQKTENPGGENTTQNDEGNVSNNKTSVDSLPIPSGNDQKLINEYNTYRSYIYSDLSNSENVDQYTDALKTNEEEYTNAGVNTTEYDETLRLAERRRLLRQYMFRIECYLDRIECDKRTKGQITKSDFERETTILNEWVNSSGILTRKQRQELRAWLDGLDISYKK